MIQATLLSALATLGAGPQAPDFDSQVRPILSDNCFACHGPDAGTRKAGLRLDTREDATRQPRRGRPAILPGDALASELWARITSTDADTVMPPPESHKQPLDAEQQTVIRAWIEDGAPWAEHWAFVPPVAPALTGSAPNPIDELVERRLAERNLELAPEAEPWTLNRRYALALTGLAPSLSDPPSGNSPTTSDWEAYVDRLLASPHYGERMAMWWLDVARYADTDGFQADEVRSNWPWRDWVVRSFQANMPFDRFTELQFAGDLLPDAGPEEILATCFQRNHMHNGEGGRDPEESRVDYVRDRVDTMGTAFLGLTLGCAQCHDHKFDPISQQDYYSLSAFFNSIDEDGRAGGRAGPFLEYDPGLGIEQINQAEREAARAEQRLATEEAAADLRFPAWMAARRIEAKAGFQAWETARTEAIESAEGAEVVQQADGTIRCLSPDQIQEDYSLRLARPRAKRITGLRLEVYPDDQGRFSFTGDGEFILTNLKLRVRRQGSSAVREIALAHASTSHQGKGVDPQYGPPKGVLDDDPRTGWTTRTTEVQTKSVLIVALEEPLVLAADEQLECVLMHRSTSPRAHLRALRLLVTDQPGQAVRSTAEMPMEALAQRLAQYPDAEEPDALRQRLYEQFLEDEAAWQAAHALHGKLQSQLDRVRAAFDPQKVTVLAERSEPRTTYVLERGVWDNHGPEVARAVPDAVFAAQHDAPPSRLDLAHWITDRDNPLTARVIANQIWQLFFGAGLVRTPGDFGLQGARPEYPEVLDWLAVDFMENGWDVKRLVRTIITSRTYRQSSAIDPELLAADPHNEWLARGPRFRLPSWMLRDQALALSGLLDRTVGGPPVYPYQPPGVWADLFMGRFEYQPTVGKSRHRRTLYAFWRRNVPPTYLFDAASRRTCDTGMRLTNTPLQALTLLNDVTYLECAKAVAEFTTLGHHFADTQVIGAMAHRVCRRILEDSEVKLLLEVYVDAYAAFCADPDAAVTLVAPSLQAAFPGNPYHDPPRLAALMTVANLLLNLDEVVTLE